MCFHQLPDYHDVIEHPMDFSTVRKKLSTGVYTTLEQFEVCQVEADFSDEAMSLCNATGILYEFFFVCHVYQYVDLLLK